jgi:hypothetical protein
MNIFLEDITPGTIEAPATQFRVIINRIAMTPDDDESGIRIDGKIEGDITGLSLQDIHDRALDRAWSILSHVLSLRDSPVNTRSRFG